MIATALAALACAASLAADSVDDGRRAFEQGDHARAVSLWRPLAEQGDPQAQFALGVMYEKGLGVARDHAQAAQLYRRAAQQGVAPAQFNLGAAYEAGRGVPRDLSLAAHWWRQAAEQSFGRAAYNLATLYYYGWGVPQNYEEAAHWYERAAKSGDPNAGRMLAALKQRIALVPAPPEPAGADGRPEVELESEAWLLDQPGSSYTIQLFANWTEASVRRFAAEAALAGPSAIFSVRYEEYPWFVLVHGVYATAGAAQRALDALPARLKLTGPWIRPVAEVQTLIRERVVAAQPRHVVLDPFRGPGGETLELSAVEPLPGGTDAGKAPATPAPRPRAGAGPGAEGMAAAELPTPAASVGARTAAGAAPAARAAPAAPRAPEPTATAAPVTPASPAADPLGWIRTQPRNRYTIQIIAEPSLEAARAFVERNGLRDEAAYFAARHEGRIWYAVVLGSFDRLAAARARLQSLPEAWQRWAPWIRDFGGIHEIMLEDLPVAAGEGQSVPPAREPVPAAAAGPPRLPADARDKLYQGQKAFNAGRYEEADRLWRPLAEAGMAGAQYNLGFLYESGWGVPVDYALAARWYRRAADQGHAQAQHNLGVMYLDGLGVARDTARGVQWLRAAAGGGDENAARRLAEAYREGRYGLPQDAERARQWSAGSGDPG